MLEIDGSIGEGGGQVLRTALSVSCAKGIPIMITKIRAGRTPRGLKPQHLGVCHLLAKMCDARMSGANIGSTEITFEPGKIRGGAYSFDIGTAGSVTLLLQAALPVMALAGSPCSLSIRGGTHVSGSPTFDYFSEVFLPAARKFGLEAEVKMNRAGFYPKGGGMVEASVRPSKFNCAELREAPFGKISYRVLLASLPEHIAKREEERIRAQFTAHELEGSCEIVDADSPGNAVSVWCGAMGASSLGEVKKSAEKVAQEACKQLESQLKSGAAVDCHLADQLLLYATLSGGNSFFSTPSFTPHLRTNAELLRTLTARNIILANECEVRIE